MLTSTPIVEAGCIDERLAQETWRAWKDGDQAAWPSLVPSLKVQLGQWLVQFFALETTPDMDGIFHDLKMDEPEWLGNSFPREAPVSEPIQRPVADSWFELILQIQTVLLEELAWRYIFWPRDDDRHKLPLIKATINLAENCQIEIIHINEFLKILGDTFGSTRRLVFQAKTLGYTYQEIADLLNIGKGSVRHHWGEALSFFLKRF